MHTTRFLRAGLPLLLVLATPVGAAQGAEGPYLTVRGESVISRAPNIADLTAVFREEREASAAAMGALRERINPLLERWRQLAGADTRVVTEAVRTAPVRERRDGRSEITGYQALLTIRIQGAPADQAGSWLQRLGEADPHQVRPIDYRYDAADEQRHPALVAAVEDAAGKAAAMAEAADVRLLEPLRVEELSAPGLEASEAGPGAARARTADAAREAADPIDLAPDELTYEASVRVRYAIEPR